MPKYLHEFVMDGSGDYVNERAGETLGKHKLVYRGVDGYWYLADADAAATMPVLGITMEQIAATRKGEILLTGYIGDVAWTWTGGAEVYASTTAGELTQTMPAVGSIIQIVAIAVDATQIQFTGNVGGGHGASNTLEGETAFVGFDPSKNHYVNYFLCDGTADDVQIQDAFDYLALLGGGSLMAEAGTYDITAVVVPTLGSFSLRGQGREATIFKLGANNHLLQLASIDDISIMDMSFDGTKATYATDLWVGLLPQTVNNLYISNCDFYDFAGKGCYAREVTNGVFSENRFYSNGQDGLYLEDNGLGDITQHISVINCFSYNNTRKGFNCGEIKDVTFTDCQSYNNTEDGWNLEGAADNSYQLENVKLCNCISHNNTSQGFRVQMECYNVELISCESYLNTGNGLYLRGNDTYPMKDIKIIGGSYYLNQLNGISIAYGMENVIIDDVALYNNDQGDTNNNGLSSSFMTNIYNVIITNTHAYDDQGAPTQNRGIDLSTADLTNHNIKVSNIFGSGNTTGLFRGATAIISEKFIKVSDPDVLIGTHPAILLPDGAETDVYDQLHWPIDIQNLVSVNVIIVAGASGNMRRTAASNWGIIDSEAYNATTDSLSGAQVALVQNILETVDISALFTGISPSDLIGFRFSRIGDHVDDTINADCYYLGVKIKYV